MGLFSKFKSIFSKKSSFNSVRDDKIKQIIKDYNDEKSTLTKLIDETKKKANDLKNQEDFFSQTKLNELVILEKLASLMDDIAMRDKVAIDTDGLESMKEFCKIFEKRLKEFNDESSFEFDQVKKIFATEISHVRNALTKLESYMTELKNIVDDKKLDKDFKKVEDLEESLEKIEKNDLPKLNEEFSILAEDGSYELLIKKKDYYKSQKEKLIQLIQSDFDIFYDSLRDYHNLNSDIGIIGLYLNSPVVALYNDDNLEIIEHLTRLARFVKKKQIASRDSKKAFLTLKKLSKEYLSEKLRDLKKIDEDIELVSRKMKEHHLDDYAINLQKKIRELSEKSEKLTQNIHKIEINIHESELKKLDETIKQAKKEL